MTRSEIRDRRGREWIGVVRAIIPGLRPQVSIPLPRSRSTGEGKVPLARRACIRATGTPSSRGTRAKLDQGLDRERLLALRSGIVRWLDRSDHLHAYNYVLMNVRAP